MALVLLGVGFMLASLRILWGDQGGWAISLATLCGVTGLALVEFVRTNRRPEGARLLVHGLSLGVLAWSINPSIGLWQVAGPWSHVFTFSEIGGLAAVSLYLVVAGGTIWRSGRPLHPTVSAALVATPFLFALLFILAAPWQLLEIVAPLRALLPFGDPTGLILGRSLVLFAFNTALATLLALVLDRSPIIDQRLYPLFALSALLAACGPPLATMATGPWVASLSGPAALAVILACVMAAQAGLWAQTFLATGLLLDAIRLRRPTFDPALAHWRGALGKAAIYSGLFMGVVLVGYWTAQNPLVMTTITSLPFTASLLLGVCLFPFARTVVESFDGSPPFFKRLAEAFGKPTNLATGAVVGAGVGVALMSDLPAAPSGERFLFGALVGVIAFAGVGIGNDLVAIFKGRRGGLRTMRLHMLGAMMGGFVGGALAWYFDSLQVGVVLAKLHAYSAIDFYPSGVKIENYIVYPLFSKWGAIDLGLVYGGARLFYSESLSGVINWSIAAPLFSINLVLLTALVQRSTAPVQRLFTVEGLVGLIEQAIRVMRWGLWMAPVIYSFLRLAPEPTWFNQDGAIRTLVAIYASSTLDPSAFRAFSFELFIGLLAYDWLRILIWADHMGLRVATLVNSSFVVLDDLDERAARFVGHAARTRIIPEGIRRFVTWAPLLIPFYIPRGTDWDTGWNRAETIANEGGPLLPAVATAMTFYGIALLLALVVAFFIWRKAKAGPDKLEPPARQVLRNGFMTSEIDETFKGWSRVWLSKHHNFEVDLTRQQQDALSPPNRALYLVDRDTGIHCRLFDDPATRQIERLSPLRVRLTDRKLGALIEVDVELERLAAIEKTTITVNELAGRARRLDLVSYREVALDVRDAYWRTQAYREIHIETVFVPELNALLAKNRALHDPATGAHADDTYIHAVRLSDDGSARLVGYQDSRNVFLGPGGILAPEGLGRHAMREPSDEGAIFTFDPVACFSIEMEIGASARSKIVMLDGYAAREPRALALIARRLKKPLPTAERMKELRAQRRPLASLPDSRVAEDVFAFNDAGELETSYDTPRPWSHVVSNEVGQGLVASNQGAIYSFFGNAQQNGLTPFTHGNVAPPMPGRVFLTKDLSTGERASPCFVPTRDRRAACKASFGLGYVRYTSEREELSQELTIFVAVDEAVEIGLWRLTNHSGTRKALALLIHQDWMLAEITNDSRATLKTRVDTETGAVLATNARNDFIKGHAFAATSLQSPRIETDRVRVFDERGPADPLLLRPAIEDHSAGTIGWAGRCASFAGELTLEPNEEKLVVAVLGQTADARTSLALAQRFADPSEASTELEKVKSFWQKKVGSLRIRTNEPAFDRMVNDWLPYQTLTARLWGRTGPEQRSGAFGFRDQLQDVLPFMNSEPELARRQILLHAARQFHEGDVLQWWHQAWNGRVGIGSRNKVADPPLWLPYLTARYITATGDHAILDCEIPFVEGDRIPKDAEGIVLAPRPSPDQVTLLDHCRRAIERLLARRGRNGLPLFQTGDWNDGFDKMGPKGRGESVWLGFFLHDVLARMEPIARSHGDTASAERWRAACAELKISLARMRRNDRWVRGIDDDGRELVIADALTASWPILSGAISVDIAKPVLEDNLAALERPHWVCLLTPAFDDDSPVKAGRIADYPPGVRENGGQYTHGSSWLVDALAILSGKADETGDALEARRLRDRGFDIWMKLSPAGKPNDWILRRFGAPPHQQPPDVYDGPGYEGRAGWTWYTGSAPRMLEAAYNLLGLEVRSGRLVLPSDLISREGRLKVKRVEWQGRIVAELREDGSFVEDEPAKLDLPARTAA